MYSVIFFDLGGVVFRDLFTGGVQDFTDAFNLTPAEVHRIYVETDLPPYSLGKLTDRERWKLFAKQANLPDDQVPRLIETYYQTYQPIAQVIDLLHELKKEYPDLRRGALSDQPTGVARMLRQLHADVFTHFDNQVTVVSSEVGLSKRNQDLSLFKLALKRAAVPAEQVLYVDDSASHLESASKLGIPGFHFDIINQAPAALITQLRQCLAH